MRGGTLQTRERGARAVWQDSGAPGAKAHPMRPDVPNLVFLLTDDHRWDALGCYGNPVLRTPAIDALAADGVRFANAFVTTSICCASRAAILTGQYNLRNGIHEFNVPFTKAQWAQTYPARLRDSGYHSGFIGKFGVGDGKPLPAASFDVWHGFDGQGRYETVSGAHLTDVMTDQAVGFLERAPTDRPFVLSVSYKAPHHQDGDPRQYIPAVRHRTLYADQRIPPPPGQDFDRLPGILRESEGRARWRQRFDTPERHAESVRNYYRLIQGVDDSVARIRETLRDVGRDRDTVIVFTGDNGAFLGEHGLADKWYLYEESVRVPMIVHDPRLPEKARGTVPDQQVLNIDIAPTLLDYAGLRRPRTMQGRSLRPLVEGKRTRWRTDWYYEHRFRHPAIPSSEGVRDQQWSYWRFLGHPEAGEFLFDHRADPFQTDNRAGDAKMRSQLERLRRRTDDFSRTLR